MHTHASYRSNKLIVQEHDDDLLPLSRPQLLGLPFQRRVLGRRIAAGQFPPVIRLNGRLFVTRKNLAEFKQRLLAEGAAATSRKP